MIYGKRETMELWLENIINNCFLSGAQRVKNGEPVIGENRANRDDGPGTWGAGDDNLNSANPEEKENVQKPWEDAEKRFQTIVTRLEKEAAFIEKQLNIRV